MKKNQSSLDNNISTFYFAVLPLQLTFKKNYDNKFTLYFEKSLQIIGKFQTHLIPKDTLNIDFPIPATIQHFRIQSQKNLDYQWSLYMHHSSENQEENEEFVQGQKISVKNAWADYNSKRESFHELDIEFNTIKCKLRFVVLIGKSNSDLHQIVEHYLESSRKKSPKKEPVHTPKNQVKRIQQQVAAPIQIKEESKKQDGRQSRQQILYSSQKILEQVSVLKQQSHKKEVQIFNRQSYDLRTPSQLNDSPAQHKLSHSQLQIGKVIERDVNIYEEAAKKVQDQIMQTDPLKQEPPRERQITLTQSQLLNQKRQVITPFYKNKKVIIAVIVILLLFGVFVILKKSNKKPSIPLKKPKQVKQKPIKAKQQKKVKGKR